MLVGPAFTRRHVVDDINPAGTDQRECIIKHFVFAWHRVGENQIERLGGLALKKDRRVLGHELQSRILT